jgi:hypothetical protein
VDRVPTQIHGLVRKRILPGLRQGMSAKFLPRFRTNVPYENGHDLNQDILPAPPITIFITLSLAPKTAGRK